MLITVIKLFIFLFSQKLINKVFKYDYEMKFKSLSELKAMKSYLEQLSCNKQSFQAYIRYTVTDILEV